MNKERILITGSVMNSDEELVNTYKSLISMIDIKNYQISTPLDTMMFKGNDYERYENILQCLNQKHNLFNIWKHKLNRVLKW